MTRLICVKVLAALAVLSVAPWAAAEPAADSVDCGKLVADVGSAYVTVKYVLKMEGQFGNRETEAEITGIMIDPSGIVLCGNTRLGSQRMMRQMGGSATPTDIKVLIGDDTEGLEARVMARDSELDLAWVQIKKPGDRKFVCLDLNKSAAPVVGQHIVALRKMAKYFDRALVLSEGRIGGKTRKPRDLLVPTGALALEPGLPIFTPAEQIVGIVVVQMPDEDELANMTFTGIGRDISNGLILPVAEVVKATARAKEAHRNDDDSDDDDKKADAKSEKSAKTAGSDAKEKKDKKKSGDEDDDDDKDE